MSCCISQAAPDWIDHWRHNDLGFYDTEELARAEIPQDGNDYEIYAYKLYPLVFDHGDVSLWGVPVRTECDLDGYVFFGYDVVSKSVSSFFQCSPLTCNLMADEFAVNRFGLIDNLENAYQAAITMSKTEPEPGPYYLFEVFRRQQDH